jgi:hypothetical protein
MTLLVSKIKRGNPLAAPRQLTYTQRRINTKCASIEAYMKAWKAILELRMKAFIARNQDSLILRNFGRLVFGCT